MMIRFQSLQCSSGSSGLRLTSVKKDHFRDRPDLARPRGIPGRSWSRRALIRSHPRSFGPKFADYCIYDLAA
jgi:hypothetical protein